MCQSLISSRDLRQQVMRLLVRLYEAAPQPDWLEVCQCLMLLDDAPEVAAILDRLLRAGQVRHAGGDAGSGCCPGHLGAAPLALQTAPTRLLRPARSPVSPARPRRAWLASTAIEQHSSECPLPRRRHHPTTTPQEEELLAYQIAFDLVENELQSFLQQVQRRLEELAPQPQPPAAANGDAEADGDAMQTEAAPEAGAHAARAGRLRDILSGKAPIGLYLEFLFANNRADLQVRARARGLGLGGTLGRCAAAAARRRQQRGGSSLTHPPTHPPPRRCWRTSRARWTRACRSPTRPPYWPTPTCTQVGGGSGARSYSCARATVSCCCCPPLLGRVPC